MLKIRDIEIERFFKDLNGKNYKNGSREGDESELDPQVLSQGHGYDGQDETANHKDGELLVLDVLDSLTSGRMCRLLIENTKSKVRFEELETVEEKADYEINHCKNDKRRGPS